MCLKRNLRVPKSKEQGYRPGRGAGSSSRKALEGRSCVCLCSWSLAVSGTQKFLRSCLRSDQGRLVTSPSLSPSATPPFQPQSIIHVSTANFKSHFTQTSVRIIAESGLAVLHSSRISGVNTFSMNLKVVFIKDPPRSYSTFLALSSQHA